MNITILKNNTQIEIINDEQINLRRDGGFDTAEIHFYNSNPELLERWDKISFEGKIWRVAEQPTVKINFKESTDPITVFEWLYTVTIIESIAMLQGWPMADIAFTQNKAVTKTFKQAIETILSKQAVISVADTQRYSLKATTGLTTADENRIAPNEVFKDKNLYQILRYYGELLDARPRLDETNDTIYFEYLNEVNSTVLEPNFFEIEISKSIEDFATDIVENAENVHVKDLVSYYPGNRKRTYFIPLNLENNLGWDNISLELPFKIKSLERLSCYIDDDPVRIIDLYKDKTRDTIGGKRYIFEEKEWQVLQNNSFWNFTQWIDWGVKRENSIYYKYGDNKIYNLKALDYHMSQANYSSRGPEYLIVYIEYEPLPGVELKQESNLTIDGGLKYIERIQQQSSTIDIEAERLRLKNDLKNRQSTYYNVGWTSDDIPDIESKVKLNQLSGAPECLITNLSAKKVGGRYELNARLASEFNKRNSLTRKINENRLFEIPTDQIVTRKIAQELNAHFYMLVGSELDSQYFETDFDNYNYAMFFKFGSGLLNTTSSVITFAEREMFIVARFYDSEYGYINVILPYIDFLNDIDNENAVWTFIATMTSNTAADMQRFMSYTAPENFTASSAIVVNEYGEAENVRLMFKPIRDHSVVNEILLDDDIIYSTTTEDLSFKEAYPFVSEEYVESFVGTQLQVFKPFSELAINKDAREKLQFEIRLKLNKIENSGPNLENIKDNFGYYGGGRPTIKAIINGIEYSCGVIYESNTRYFNKYVKLTYIYPQSGNLTAIILYQNGNEIIRTNYVKTIFANEEDFVTICVGKVI